jgi:hypothetical protein
MEFYGINLGRLRSLRRWHWREAEHYRQRAHIAFTKHGRRTLHERADFHDKAVQTLDALFAPTDKAENDI